MSGTIDTGTGSFSISGGGLTNTGTASATSMSGSWNYPSFLASETFTGTASDTDFDGVPDTSENCPSDANSAQTNSDAALNLEGVTIYGALVPANSDGNDCDDDDDNDSPTASPTDWTDAIKFYLTNDNPAALSGTAQTEACPRTIGVDDFWMPDNNHDRVVNSSDLGKFKLQFQAAAGGAGTDSQRQDFNMDGNINSSDLGKFRSAFQGSCTVP